MLEAIGNWMSLNRGLLMWVGAASLGLMVVGLLLLPVVVARLPAGYLLHQHPMPMLQRTHPVLRVVLLVLKNLMGGVLTLAGIAMLFLPGPGILTIIVGVSLMNLPGKRRVVLWIVRHKSIYQAINYLRRRAGKKPLRLPVGKSAT